MVTVDIPPGNAHPADGLVVGAKQIQVVADQVTQAKAKGDILNTDHFFYYAAVKVTYFFQVVRLRIAKEQAGESFFLFGRQKSKIYRFRQLSGRRYAGKVQFWRTLGFVDVVKLRQVQFVDRYLIATGLDDENDLVIVYR